MRRTERPDVCLLCPFDLERSTGTPLRARATLEALRGRLDVRALGTREAEGVQSLQGVFRKGRLSPAHFFRAAFRELVQIQPRVVHCFTPLAAVPALAARPLTKSRIVVEVHGPAEYELARARAHVRAFFISLDKYVVRRADAVLAMSAKHATYLRVRCGVRVPIRVSWGPIDVSGRKFVVPNPEVPRRFGYFGNARFWQGIDHLVAAANVCPKDLLTVSLTGLEMSELPPEADGIVTVRGRLGREAMLEEMTKCDVLLSPRRGGPVADLQYPFKLSAYLSAGRAVIATDVGDQGAIVRSAGCGAVVSPDSPADLASAMIELAKLGDDELTELGYRARRFAEDQLGFDRLRAELSELYQVTIS